MSPTISASSGSRHLWPVSWGTPFMWLLSLILSFLHWPLTGSVCSCHISHRLACDGGWFCWYADIQRQIVAVAGPRDEWDFHGHAAIRYISIMSHSSHIRGIISAHPDQQTQTKWQTSSHALQAQTTRVVSNHSIHKHRRTHLQDTTVYPTLSPIWCIKQKASSNTWTDISAVFMQMKWTAKCCCFLYMWHLFP